MNKNMNISLSPDKEIFIKGWYSEEISDKMKA